MVIVYVYKTIKQVPRLKQHTWFLFSLTFFGDKEEKNCH